MPPKRRKKPAKGITLDKGVWLRKGDVKLLREETLEQQGGVCAISGVPLTTGTLDHDHASGKVRGVLLSEVNTLEGKFLRGFKKLKLAEKYGIPLPDMLISMGEYLKGDYSDSKLHYGLMEAKRKEISRLTKIPLRDKLLKDYGIDSDGDKKELVGLYIQSWVDDKGE